MNAILITAGGAYAVMGLISAGYALRSQGPRSYVLGFAVVLLWPIYWLVDVGPTEILRRLVAAFFTEDGAVSIFCLIALYGLIVLMFPAYYIAKTWDACAGLGCVGILAKAAIWAPFWPAYLLAAITR
jgi:hypothetical protein